MMSAKTTVVIGGEPLLCSSAVAVYQSNRVVKHGTLAHQLLPHVSLGIDRAYQLLTNEKMKGLQVLLSLSPQEIKHQDRVCAHPRFRLLYSGRQSYGSVSVCENQPGSHGRKVTTGVVIDLHLPLPCVLYLSSCAHNCTTSSSCCRCLREGMHPHPWVLDRFRKRSPTQVIPTAHALTISPLEYCTGGGMALLSALIREWRSLLYSSTAAGRINSKPLRRLHTAAVPRG